MTGSARTVPEARLLIVDDEQSIIELLTASLQFHGFEVHSATDGATALSLAKRIVPDVIVTDVMMPGLDGFDLVRALRADGYRMPALFLTARDAVEDRVAGLTLGGDDYITKPFSLAEVVARIRVALRHVGRSTIAVVDDEALQYADLELDEATHEVRRAGELVDLSPTEFRLLAYLLENAERVVSKNQILDHVWQYDFGGDANVVETYISYLRKKVDRREPRLIHTVRGFGYVLRIRS